MRFDVKCMVDCHCHLHEFTDVRVSDLVDKFTIVAVSDDEASSLRTLMLAERYKSVVPCVGVHPWSVKEVTMDEVERVCRLAERASCIGEVGLDARFTPETIDRQREIFTKFLSLAREYDLVVNVHAAGAWREALDLLIRFDVKRALFHWYTGPLELIDEIVRCGYYISINPAVKLQLKHRRVVEKTPLDRILVESDGPYSYRGLELDPYMISDVIAVISEVKRLPSDEVRLIVINNFKRLFNVS